MKYVLVFLIALYQKLLSPWLPPACRYTPTCSQYAREALLKHGADNPAARALLDFLKTPQAHAVIRGYGYDL